MSAPNFVLVEHTPSLIPSVPFDLAWVERVRELRRSIPALFSLDKKTLNELLEDDVASEQLLRALAVSSDSERKTYRSWVSSLDKTYRWTHACVTLQAIGVHVW